MNLVVIGFTPFVDPLPIWSPGWLWAVLLIPLCAAVAVVYKSIKCGTVSHIPREALGLFITIMLGMVLAAGALAALVRFVQ